MVRRNRLRSPLPGPRTSSSHARPNGSERRRHATDRAFSSLQLVWRAVARRLPEIGRGAAWYASVQGERGRAALHAIAERLLKAMLGIVAVAAVIAIATALLLQGVAAGVATALGDRVWLADALTGAVALAMVGTGISITIGLRQGRRLRRLRDRQFARAAAEREAPTGDGGSPNGTS